MQDYLYSYICIGNGLFNNVYGRNGSYVTAGEKDYAECMNEIERQKEDYYKQLGVALGVPTMKGAYGDPENTKRGYNSIIDTLGNHDVPQGWIQTPKPNTTPNTNPGPPVSWNDPSNPDAPQAGYGYIPNDTTKEETFFYHSDHLGSTSYITDDKGNITQYDAYLPYGELLVDEHSSSEDMPYKFNGKELDQETGLYYYGARYLDPRTSLWLSIDRFTEKYSNVSGYNYCINNPIFFSDVRGDSTIVDKFGYLLERRGNNNIVYRAEYNKNGVKYIAIGEVGKVIHVNVIYKNLLQKNSASAKKIWSPFRFRNLVKTNGEWDLKNNKKTIYGIANDGNTRFEFQGKMMEAQDIGNHHFGVVVEAYGLFPEEFALKQAGEYQIKSGTSKPEWQRYAESVVISPTTGTSFYQRGMLSPYGDDPRDQKWIREGFEYYKKNKRK